MKNASRSGRRPTMNTKFERLALMLLGAMLITFYGLVFNSFAYTAIINGEYVEMVDGQVVEPVTADDYEFALAEAEADCIDITESPNLEEVTVELNPYQKIAVTTTEEEWRELEWVAALEAGNQGLEGEIRVIEAIFNRILSTKNWGNTVHEVLSKKGQFSTYKYIGSAKAWKKPGQLESDAIAECIALGPHYLPSTKYVYFDSKGGVNGYDTVRYKGHWFSREK